MYPCPRTGPLLWQPEPQGPQLSGIDLRFFYPPPSDGGASMILLLCSAAKSRQVHIIYLQSTDGQSRWANAMKGWVLHGCLCWCWIGISPRKKVYGLAEMSRILDGASAATLNGVCLLRIVRRSIPLYIIGALLTPRHQAQQSLWCQPFLTQRSCSYVQEGPTLYPTDIYTYIYI